MTGARPSHLEVARRARARRLAPLLLPLALAACQQQAAPPLEGLVVTPAAVMVVPGQQVQFTLASPAGAEVTWSVQPATEGTITQSGLFTAAARPVEVAEMCTVMATLKSDPTKIGLAVVTFQILPPVNMVAASGRRQSADGIEVESVVQEPVTSVTAISADGTTEVRSGFYPSGSTSP